jgi:hypothetical protein
MVTGLLRIHYIEEEEERFISDKHTNIKTKHDKRNIVRGYQRDLSLSKLVADLVNYTANLQTIQNI